MSESPQKIRIVIRADHSRLRTGRDQPCQPPARIAETYQDESQEQIRHENLLRPNIRAVGRLGP